MLFTIFEIRQIWKTVEFFFCKNYNVTLTSVLLENESISWDKTLKITANETFEF
jgi:hypothetical protein